jgi:hypothetical protein
LPIFDQAMLSATKYWLQLRHLSWKEWWVRTRFRTLERRTRKNGTPQQLQLIIADGQRAVLEVQEHRESLRSLYLVDLAARFMLPYPIPATGLPGSQWTFGLTQTHLRLTQAAFWRLSQRVRQERKERSERWNAAIAPLALLIGLLGAFATVVDALGSYRAGTRNDHVVRGDLAVTMSPVSSQAVPASGPGSLTSPPVCEALHPESSCLAEAGPDCGRDRRDAGPGDGQAEGLYADWPEAA